MFKYWLKNRFAWDGITGVLLALLYVFAFIYPSNASCQSIENENAIYLKNSIDYQIPNPSRSQAELIKKESFVNDIFCYYLTKANVSGNASSRINVLMSDTLDGMGFTMYNESNKLESISKTGLWACLDKTAADSLNVSCGDEVTFSIAGTQFKYEVCSIYLENPLFREGSLIVEYSGALKTTYLENVQGDGYSGAFIDASNEASCETYLKSYIPEGRLKDRSLFDSDEEFNAYNDAIKSADYSNEITNFAESRAIAKKSLSSASSQRSLMAYLGMLTVMVASGIVNIILRIRKSEKSFFKNVLKNKASIRIYRLMTFACSLLVYGVCLFVPQLFLGSLPFSLLPALLSCLSFPLWLFVNLILDRVSYTKKGGSE